MVTKTVIRSVKEFDAGDRQALEHVLGQALGQHQQVVIRVIDADIKPSTAARSSVSSAGEVPGLPEWCNVYDGLTDDEIAEMERTILMRAVL